MPEEDVDNRINEESGEVKERGFLSTIKRNKLIVLASILVLAIYFLYGDGEAFFAVIGIYLLPVALFFVFTRKILKSKINKKNVKIFFILSFLAIVISYLIFLYVKHQIRGLENILYFGESIYLILLTLFLIFLIKIYKASLNEKINLFVKVHIIFNLVLLIMFSVLLVLVNHEIIYYSTKPLIITFSVPFLVPIIASFIGLYVSRSLRYMVITSIASSIFYGLATIIYQINQTYVPYITNTPSSLDGRPLRIDGRNINAELCDGSDWTQGEHPDISDLDKATCIALEESWLQSARGEHASVPAFSRISWQLAAAGAPAELLEWSHKAAIEEIKHARLCFALAEGYGGRSHSVKPMPELLSGGLDLKDDLLITLAKESIIDGCLMEGFFSDIAAISAKACEDRVIRNVLDQIAVEEESHADFAWAILDWLQKASPENIYPVIEKTYSELDSVKRPSAIGWDKNHLLTNANTVQMLKHGRLSDKKWEELWNIRLLKTKKLLKKILDDEILCSNKINVS